MFAIKLRLFVNSIIRKYPSIYFFIMSHRKKFKNVIVNDDTEIVIEGYPRSANTYAVAAFLYAQKRNVNIGRHTHSIAQVLRAVERNLPIVVVVRKPEDAILSYKIRENSLSLSSAINQYKEFYSVVLKNMDRIIVVDFDSVIFNFNDVIDKVNNKYKTKYEKYLKNAVSEEEIFKIVEEMEMCDSGGILRETHVARPSEARNSKKLTLVSQFSNKKNAESLKVCNELYLKLINIDYDS